MSNEKMETVCRMVERECQRNSLVDLLESYDLTENDWFTFINRGLGCGNNDYKATPPNPPLTIEQLKDRVGKPVWCKRNKAYGVIGVKGDRYVIGFYYGWEWLEDLTSRDIYDHEPKGVRQ